MDPRPLIDAARRSELFTSPRLAADLPVFLAEHEATLDALAQRTALGDFDHVWFVGSGGSWSNMYSGKHLMDRVSAVPSDVSLPYDLVWKAPHRLTGRSLVFLASYSGATEDTLAAMRFANERGAHTVALVRRRDSPMAREASTVVDYDSTALYIVPLAAVTSFALRVARHAGQDVTAALDGLAALPEVLGRVYGQGEKRAVEDARSWLSSTMMYCVGSGPLYGLAYKFALTVFMENIRVHGSAIEAAELRHGPVEAFERSRPDMVFLLGTDESRDMVQRALQLAQRGGARTLVYDAADYPEVHPLLTPFVLLIPLEYFTVASAVLRGITDLDERVYMGHRLLAQGEDATWP